MRLGRGSRKFLRGQSPKRDNNGESLLLVLAQIALAIATFSYALAAIASFVIFLLIS